jgi:hypothetical protein
MANNERGFQIDLDQARAIVKIRIWGVWNRALAEQYTQTLTAYFEQIKASQRQWRVLIDVSRYPLQLPEIQAVISQGVSRLQAYTTRKRAILVNGAITQFRPPDFMRGAGLRIYSYFRSEDDAIRWLLDEPAPQSPGAVVREDRETD